MKNNDSNLYNSRQGGGSVARGSEKNYKSNKENNEEGWRQKEKTVEEIC